MDARYYPGVEVDIPQLVSELRRLFDTDDYQVQTMQVSATVVLQARKTSMLRDLTGLSSALTVKITPEHGGLRVEIGMQKWFDKAAVAAIVVFLSAGMLLALPALGAYWQYRLTEDTWKLIEEHISRRAGGYVPPMPGRCGNCGAVTLSDSAFCTTCGARLRLQPSCDSCGSQQRDPAARFCNRCGKTLSER